MGFFAIGVYQPKTKENIGTLWRSAYQLGASFIFVINHRYKKQYSDTCKSHRHIPLFQFNTIETFLNSRVYDCQIICIENTQGAEDLRKFEHPKNCIYLLGSEDNGLPADLCSKYKNIIIPSIRIESYNVAMAGTLIMYDRLNKN